MKIGKVSESVLKRSILKQIKTKRNEVLNGASETPVTGNLADGEKYDSAGLREACLREALGLKDQGECAAGDSECWDLRKWTKAKSSSN